MGADGLDGVWLRPVVTSRPQGQLVVDLFAARGDARVRLERRVVTAAEASASARVAGSLAPDGNRPSTIEMLSAAWICRNSGVDDRRSIAMSKMVCSIGQEWTFRQDHTTATVAA